MKQCPHCHHINPDAARFCTGCGAILARQCESCGKQAPADARYCPNCGAPLLSTPEVPWVERRFSAATRQGLHALTRALGITFIVMAFLLTVLTPPPRFIDDIILLIVGATLIFISEVLKSGRKPKPPGGNRDDVPPPPSPGGYEIIPPEEWTEIEAKARASRVPPPGSTQGPYLN